MTKSGQPPPHNWKKMRQHMWFCRSHVSSITHFFSNYFIACVLNGWAMKIEKKTSRPSLGLQKQGCKITPRLQRGHIPFQTHDKLTDWLIWEELVKVRKTIINKMVVTPVLNVPYLAGEWRSVGCLEPFYSIFAWEEGSREASNWTTVMILSNFRCAYIYCSPIQGE